MNRIALLRKEKGITQNKLAKMLGITQANLSGWENNKWQPDQESLIKLAKYFDSTVDYIIGNTDTPETLVEHNSSKEEKPQNIGEEYLLLAKDIQELDEAGFNEMKNYLEYLKHKTSR